MIKQSLEEAVGDRPTVPVHQKKEETRWTEMEAFLHENGWIQNADVRKLFDVSPATANRILTALTKEGKLRKIRNGRYWAYKLVE